MEKKWIAAAVLGAALITGIVWVTKKKVEVQASPITTQAATTDTVAKAAPVASSEVQKSSNDVFIEGGEYTRTDDQGKKEKVKVVSFFLDKNLTTVAEFEAFTKATNYVTDAEKFGNSAILDNGQWTLKEGANYLYPFGREAGKADGNHPVTQVSWNDAIAYAKWKNKRLPSEKEWEFAATNRGKEIGTYAWGNSIESKGKYLANTFQGSFPNTNSAQDGYVYTSPIGTFPANKLGLYDIGGNVWQYTSDILAPTAEQAQQDPSPRHPLKGASFITDLAQDKDALLFHHSSTTPETGVFHTGFRLARDVE